MTKVLLVEDSKFFGKLVQKQIMDKLGFEVVWVQTYAEAEMAIQTHEREFLLGLFDLNLPDAPTGKSIELAESKHIPAIVFTAMIDEATRNKISSKKIIDYVLKEGLQDIDYLISLIERIDKNRSTTILVVDDSRTARRYICGLLNIHQYRLLEAENGGEALDLIKAHPEIRMVITDYEMPVMDGFELTKALRARYKKEELSIIGVSAQDNHILAAKFIKNGANDFIGKPFFIEEFYCRITQNIEIIEHIESRKRVEMDLRIAMSAAKEATQAKSQFLANMSHEIRTPLHGIIGLAELAGKTGLSEQQRQLIATIDSEATLLLKTINDILDYSKIEAGKMDLENMPFDLREIFEGMVRNMAYNAHKRGLLLYAYLPATVPTQIVGDMVKLRQILVNLVGNALKFTPDGEIDIRCELKEDLGDRVLLLFTVRDTGIGIDEGNQKKIFESFTQADGTTSRKYGGTGLGVTIAKQFAEMMGGHMGVRSEPNKGSTFWFTAVFGKQAGLHGQASRSLPFLHGKRFLIVASNQANQFILSEEIKLLGGEPVSVPDGKTALSTIRTEGDGFGRFEGILFDVNLEDMTGFDLAELFKQEPRMESVPLIPLVPAGLLAVSDQCEARGFPDWVTTPVVCSELKALFVKLFGDEAVFSEASLEQAPLKEEDKIQDFSGARILLAEDYPTNQMVALRHINGAGLQAELAVNGAQAVAKFKSGQFDLILMDIQMPEMDGLAATRAIRVLERSREKDLHHRIPIIAMTAHASKRDKEEAMNAGMDDFLNKPIRQQDLMPVITKWLTSNKTTVAPQDNADWPSDFKSQASLFSPMDIDRAIAEFDGDRSFVLEVLSEFLKSVKSQLESIHRALSENDTDVVKKEAHSIKGGAGNLAAFALMRAAESVEKSVSKGRFEDCAKGVAELEAAYNALAKFGAVLLRGETQ